MQEETNSGDFAVSILLVGMSHRSAPVPLLEKVTVGETERPETLARLVADDAVTEALLVSTCNRVEYYVACRGFHAGLSAVIREISDRTGIEVDQLSPYLYVRYAEGTAEHMLSVASGLDSMVIGEQQILGQIRTAYAEATEVGAAGRTIHELASKALQTGKRVHTETGIDDAGASMVSVAVDSAVAYLVGSFQADDPYVLDGRTALILGAGAMSSLAATHMGRLGISHLTIANRTLDRAENLVNHSLEAGVPASAIALDDFADVIDDVDILVSATGSVTPVVDLETVQASMARRDGRPLALVDLSMPRDIAEGVELVPGVSLFNIEHLQESSRHAVGMDEEAAARSIVHEELTAYLAAQRAIDVAPTIKALRERAGEVVRSEMDRLESKTPGLTDRERDEVARTVKRVVDKILHVPTVQVKRLSGQPGGASYAEALKELFDLPLDLPEGIGTDTGIPADIMVADGLGSHDAIVRTVLGGQND